MGNGHYYQHFCIVQTKNIMILFMFNYLTVLYAFFLVLATILVLRLHSCYSCVKLCRRCGRRNIRGSIVDGLSAFLVLCYFQCAVTTPRILASPSLYGIGDKLYKTYTMVGSPEVAAIARICVPPVIHISPLTYPKPHPHRYVFPRTHHTQVIKISLRVVIKRERARMSELARGWINICVSVLCEGPQRINFKMKGCNR